jgi:hypothetical protein
MTLKKQNNIWKLFTILSALTLLVFSIGFIKYFPLQTMYGQVMCYNTDSTLIHQEIGYIYSNQVGNLFMNGKPLTNNCIVERYPFDLYTARIN